MGGIGSSQTAAQLPKAFSSVIVSQEQARITREKATQALIDTQPKRFDFEIYRLANTPTYSDTQIKLAQQIHKRILSNASPADIVNGTGLNVLLDDVRKHPGKKAVMESIPISEDVLRRLNALPGSGNMGLLRDDGKFSFPAGLQSTLTQEQSRTIETLARNAVARAKAGKVDPDALREMRLALEQAQLSLVKKVNDIPTGQYLEGRQFLREFNDAHTALERGDAKAHFDYQDFVAGGKTVQEVVDYMVSRGLKWAPATYGDEAAYRAFHSALAALNVALNTEAEGGASLRKGP
ncbi:MAG: hypothetical protein K2X38_06575 [Gemmataceae bacterium]|nr:hypothetical protein [Gemmataceae bacterium]